MSSNAGDGNSDAKRIFVTFAGTLGRRYKDEVARQVESYSWEALIDEREAGGEWEPKVRAMAQQCDAAIALVDADWLRSPFVNEHEAPVCLGRCLRRDIEFVPIQLLDVHVSLPAKTYRVELAPGQFEDRKLTEISWSPSSPQANGHTGIKAPPLLADPDSPNRRSFYYQEAIGLIAKFFAEVRPERPDAPPSIDPPSTIEAFEHASKVLLDYPRWIDKQWIPRPQLEELWNQILGSSRSTTLLLGGPGSGKSAFLAELACRAHTLRDEGWVVLAIKADKLPATVTSAESLAEALGLPGTPLEQVWALAQQGKRCLVLVDQLDVLLDLAGVHLHRLAAVLDFIEQVSELDDVHVVSSCRRKEYERNTRLMGVEPQLITLELPPMSAVESILQGRSLQLFDHEPPAFLRVPLYLRMFMEHVDVADARRPLASGEELLGRIIEDKLSEAATSIAIDLALEMGKLEQLWLPRDAMDRSIDDAIDELIEHELGGWEDKQFSFCHQLVFEVFWARSVEQEGFGIIVEGSQTTTNWARIRNALRHLQARDPTRFADELCQLWDSDRLAPPLRFVVLDVVAQSDAPSPGELEWLRERLSETRWREHAMRRLRSLAWFDLLVDELDEILGAWGKAGIAAGPLLHVAAGSRSTEVAKLIGTHWLVPEMTRSAQWLASHLPLTEPLVRALWREITSLGSLEFYRFIGFLEKVDDGEFAAELLGRAVAARLRAALADEGGLAGPKGPVADALRFDWHASSVRVLQRAPQRFLDQVWDVLQRVADMSDKRPPRWGGYPESKTVPRWARRGQHHTVLKLVRLAVVELARRDDQRLIRLLTHGTPASTDFVHALILAALEHAPAKDVIAYLEAQPERLGTIGGRRGKPWPVHDLLAATAPKVTDEELLRLERLIRERPSIFAGEAGAPQDEARAAARAELDDGLRIWLLRALPRERLSAETLAWMDGRAKQLDFDWPQEEPESQIRLSASAREPLDLPTMSDEELRDHLSDDPHDLWPIAGELGQLLAESPQRAEAILGRLAAPQLEATLTSVLGAWARNGERDALLHWVEIADKRGCRSARFRSAAANGLEHISKTGLDDSVCTMLEEWLADQSWNEVSAFEPTPVAPELTSLFTSSTSDTNTSAASDVLMALLVGLLSRESPADDRALAALDQHLDVIRRTDDLVSLVRRLGWFSAEDDARRRVFDIIEASPELVESGESVGVFWKLRSEDPSLASRLDAALARLRDGDWEYAKRAYAEIVAISALSPGYDWASDIVRQALETVDHQPDATMLATLTLVAAEGFDHETFQSTCAAWLQRVAPFVAQASHELRRVWRSPLSHYAFSTTSGDVLSLMPLMQSAATYPALLEGAGDDVLVAARDVAEAFPAHAFALTKALLDTRGDMLALVEHQPLVQIISSLQRAPGYRAAAFSLLDMLFENNVWGLESVIDELERPAPEPSDPAC